jgi:hypothetical protein
LIVLVASVSVYRNLPGEREYSVFDTHPPTPYFHYRPIGTSRDRILIIHGLDASKSVVNVFSYALADAGFEVFAIDLPGHGDSPARFSGLDARDAVDQVLQRLGPETLAIGHSLGGAVLLDVANDRRIPKLVLYSPAPTPLETVQADRILVLEGEFDPGHIREFASRIRDTATGSVDVRDMPWTGHSGGLLKPWTTSKAIEWLGGEVDKTNSTVRLLLLGIALISGVGAACALLGMLPIAVTKPANHPVSRVLSHYVLGALAATLIASYIPLFSWLRLYATHYLIAIVFLTGVALIVRFRPILKTSGRNLLVALVATGVVIALLRIVVSEIATMTLSAERWWRFPVIAALSLPLFFADEALLRPARWTWRSTALVLVTRVVLGAVVVTGGLILYRESAFLLLMMHGVILLWMLLWLGGHLVRRHTDAFSAALFAALLQAWVFSALFVIT